MIDEILRHNRIINNPLILLAIVWLSALTASAQTASDSIATAFPQENAAFAMSYIRQDSVARAADAPVRVPTGIGLKTNLLYDAALIPNIGVEIPAGGHFSVGADWMYAWWKNRARNRHWRIYGGDVYARYWPGRRRRTLSGHHIGLYATVLLYQVAFGKKGYISGIPGENMTGGKPWLGAGLEYGYSLRLNRRLALDFALGIGYAGGEQREYRMEDDCYVWQASRRKHWFGPTKAEIALVWKLGKMQQAEKKGKEDEQ